MRFKDNIRSPEKSEREGRPFTMTGGTAQEREQAEQVLRRMRTRAIAERPVCTEDAETKRMLGVVNNIIATDLQRLGFSNTESHVFKPLTIEEVQGVPQVLKGDAGDMVYDDVLDIIQYKTGQSTVAKFVGLLHEGIHTTQSLELAPMWMSYGASTPTPTVVRGGYMTGVAYRGGSPPYWKWCNEAVVHSETLDLIQRNIPVLLHEFPGTTEEMWLNQDQDMYAGPRKLLDRVQNAYAKQSSARIEDVRDDFFRRHVNGDMSHLDRFDEIFGTGAKDKLEHIDHYLLKKEYDTTTEFLQEEI